MPTSSGADGRRFDGPEEGTVTTETRLLLHEPLRAVVDQANQQGLPFRFFRKLGPTGFVETVVLEDVVFQCDGVRVRQGVWDGRLVITGEGVFTLDGTEA